MSDAPSSASSDGPGPRLVTLLIDDPAGLAGPFPVESPWWQEAGPVIDVAQAALDTTVSLVRLLHNDGPFPGGRLTYLAEAPDVDRRRLSPVDPATSALVRPDPNRAPFAEVGGPTAAIEWAKGQLLAAGVIPSGEVRQVRTWNLAGIWRLSTTNGDAWLKSTPHFLAHEAEVLRLFQPSCDVPTLIAGEVGRSLMWDAPGQDGYDATEAELTKAVDVLLDLQRAVDLARTSAVPVRDEQLVTERLTDLASRHGSSLDLVERRLLERLVDSLPERFAAAAPLGETLVHGDVHGGNLRLRSEDRDGRPLLLDWGDSFIGSPLFDVFAPESYSMPGADRITGHWLDRLSERHGVNAHEAWRAFKPVAALDLALVYQRFCDNIEEAELDYHRNDIVPALRAGLAAAA